MPTSSIPPTRTDPHNLLYNCMESRALRSAADSVATWATSEYKKQFNAKQSEDDTKSSGLQTDDLHSCLRKKRLKRSRTAFNFRLQ
jgi:hypothetical protein